MSTVAQIDMVNKTIDTFEIDTVEKTESHEEFMHRRSHDMAGMIGMLQGRLEMLDIQLDSTIEYVKNVADAKEYMRDMRKDILKTMLEYTERWLKMQNYEETEYMYGRHKEKIQEYANKLNNLK